MNFEGNILYKEVFRSDNIVLYAPVEDYHISRYIAANAQNIYSSCGITRELLSSFLDEFIRQANDEKIKQLRTNIGVLANNLKYRLQYPVDEECAIRMGAIYTFMQGEDPNTVVNAFTEAKVNAARQDPALYAFFLNEGIKLTPSWTGFDSPLTDTEYLMKRQLELNRLSLV